MEDIDKNANGSVEESLKSVVNAQTMPLEEVLIICQQLGRQLHDIPKKQRQLMVSRMLEHASLLSKQDHKNGALMFLTVAASGEYFGQNPDNFSKTMQRLLAEQPTVSSCPNVNEASRNIPGSRPSTNSTD